MDFFVRDDDNIEKGPIDAETLQKWVEKDILTEDMEVRNSLLGKWKKASDIDFLKPLLDAQKLCFEAQEQAEKSSIGKLFSTIRAKSKKDNEPEPPKEKGTAFIYKYLPTQGPWALRLLSGITDLLICGFLAIIFFFVLTSSVYVTGKVTTKEGTPAPLIQDPAQEKPARQTLVRAEGLPSASDDELKGFQRGSIWVNELNTVRYVCIDGSASSSVWVKESYILSVFYKLFALWTILVLLYFGIALGLYAQTVGMWYWGLFICKPNLNEAYCLRAFIFGVLMILFGWLSPLWILLNPWRVTLHEYISGVRLIRISAKPKN